MSCRRCGFTECACVTELRPPKRRPCPGCMRGVLLEDLLGQVTHDPPEGCTWFVHHAAELAALDD